MVRRLVLGCGRAGETVVGVVSTWGGDLRAVVPDEARAESIEGTATVVHGDPTDPETYPESVDVVLVLGEDGERNLAAARQARESFPDALIVACGGREGPDVVGELGEVADRVVDARALLTDHLLDSVTGENAQRVCRLLHVLRDIDGRLAVVMHDNPDPDAIASGVAMCRLAEATGTDAEACYYGDISHQENRAMVNLLDLDLRTLGPDDDLGQFGGFALVDHARPSINDQLPEELHVDIVVDHHPPRGPVQGRYQDIRTDVGSTSTLLTDHCHRLGVRLDESVATALLYGIQIDTNEFRREASRLDFEAAARLLPYVDEAVLDRIESPSVDGETLDTLSRAIENREVRGSVIVTGVGSISDRDALPQAADKLLTMSGITCTLVYGFIDDTTYVSARARGTDVDLGETLRAAFNQIGSAGGHADMAGAQIPVTQAFGECVDEAERDEAIRDIITDRFFDAWYERPRDSDVVTPPRGSSGLPYDRE